MVLVISLCIICFITALWGATGISSLEGTAPTYSIARPIERVLLQLKHSSVKAIADGAMPVGVPSQHCGVGLGETAKFDDVGYQSVASLCCTQETEVYIKRFIQARGWTICSSGGVAGVALWFDCTDDAQTFASLDDAVSKGLETPCAWLSTSNVCPSVDTCPSFPTATMTPCGQSNLPSSSPCIQSDASAAQPEIEQPTSTEFPTEAQGIAITTTNTRAEPADLSTDATLDQSQLQPLSEPPVQPSTDQDMDESTPPRAQSSLEPSELTFAESTTESPTQQQILTTPQFVTVSPEASSIVNIESTTGSTAELAASQITSTGLPMQQPESATTFSVAASSDELSTGTEVATSGLSTFPPEMASPTQQPNVSTTTLMQAPEISPELAVDSSTQMPTILDPVPETPGEAASSMEVPPTAQHPAAETSTTQFPQNAQAPSTDAVTNPSRDPNSQQLPEKLSNPSAQAAQASIDPAVNPSIDANANTAQTANPSSEPLVNPSTDPKSQVAQASTDSSAPPIDGSTDASTATVQDPSSNSLQPSPQAQADASATGPDPNSQAAQASTDPSTLDPTDGSTNASPEPNDQTAQQSVDPSTQPAPQAQVDPSETVPYRETQASANASSNPSTEPSTESPTPAPLLKDASAQSAPLSGDETTAEQEADGSVQATESGAANIDPAVNPSTEANSDTSQQVSTNPSSESPANPSTDPNSQAAQAPADPSAPPTDGSMNAPTETAQPQSIDPSTKSSQPAPQAQADTSAIGPNLQPQKSANASGNPSTEPSIATQTQAPPPKDASKQSGPQTSDEPTADQQANGIVQPTATNESTSKADPPSDPPAQHSNHEDPVSAIECWSFCYFSMKCKTTCPEGERPIGPTPACATSGEDSCTHQWEGQLASFDWMSPERCQCQCWTTPTAHYNVTIDETQGQVVGGEILKMSETTTKRKRFGSGSYRCDGDPLTIDGAVWGNLGRLDNSRACKSTCDSNWACIFAVYNRATGQCTAFGSCSKVEDETSSWDVYEKACAA